MARNRLPARRFGTARRETSWLDIEPVRVAFTAAGGTITHAMTAAELARRPFTVVRTYLAVHIETDQLAADEFQHGAVGLEVVTSQAIAAGVGSIPTPVTDAASDQWFLHQWLQSDFTFLSGVGFDADAGRTYDIESKAMRKVNDDSEITIVGEFSTGVSNGFILTVAGRMLIKEH